MIWYYCNPQLSNAFDKVTKKFFHLYEGPYKINQIKSSNAYQLCDINDATKIKDVFNRTTLKKYNYNNEN